MAFRRRVSPAKLAEGVDLTNALVGIGMQLATRPKVTHPNLEDTLLAASIEGLERDDLRVLSILVTWISVHSAWINADRLVRAVTNQSSRRVRAFWASIGRWLEKDRRLARLKALHKGRRIDLLRVGTAFQIKRKGEDPRFRKAPLRVPAGILRDRKKDVLLPSLLAKRHPTYKCRVLMGPSYRADMWAALESDPDLSAADLARKTYGSFATAWQVKRDWEMLTIG